MSKKPGRPAKTPETVKGGRSTIVLAGRVLPHVADRFDAFIDRYTAFHGLRTERSAHVEKAIVEYLDREEEKLK